MDSVNAKGKIRRPVVRVSSSGQMNLFGQAKPSSLSRHRDAQTQPSLKFVDPDPEAMAFGDNSLRHYLTMAGLEFAFVMRELFDVLDWSEFEARYKPGGRPPYSPRRMVSLIVYGITQGSDSLRALEQLARRDLVALWLTGGICPDHSKIGRFINLHKEELAGSLFESMTKEVLSRLPEINREISGDGTIIEAAASRYTQIEKEAAKQWAKETREISDSDPDDPKKRQDAEQAERCLDAIEKRKKARLKSRSKNAENVRLNPHEPDANIHRFKRGGFGFGYLPSLMVNLDRIIVAQTVHQSSENAVVAQQLEQTCRVLDDVPVRLCLDSGYFCYDIIRAAYQQGLDLLCPSKEQTPRSKTPKKFPKSQFQYDPDNNTYQCPAGQTLTPTSKGFDKQTSQHYQQFSTSRCNDGCPMRDQCTTAKRGRVLKRLEDDDLLDTMREVMHQPRAQKAYARRKGSVEPVFGELRHVQGLNRFRRKGLGGVLVEFALHSMAHNLRRLWRILKIYPGQALNWPYFLLLACLYLVSWLKRKPVSQSCMTTV